MRLRSWWSCSWNQRSADLADGVKQGIMRPAGRWLRHDPTAPQRSIGADRGVRRTGEQVVGLGPRVVVGKRHQDNLLAGLPSMMAASKSAMTRLSRPSISRLASVAVTARIRPSSLCPSRHWSREQADDPRALLPLDARPLPALSLPQRTPAKDSRHAPCPSCRPAPEPRAAAVRPLRPRPQTRIHRAVPRRRDDVPAVARGHARGQRVGLPGSLPGADAAAGLLRRGVAGGHGLGGEVVPGARHLVHGRVLVPQARQPR